MAKEKNPQDKIKPFATISGGKKATGGGKKINSKGKSSDVRHQIYVSDAQFKKAMDLVREDMNNALHLSGLANTQHYFLVKFLTRKGLIEEEEFTRFVQEELTKLSEKGKNQ